MGGGFGWSWVGFMGKFQMFYDWFFFVVVQGICLSEFQEKVNFYLKALVCFKVWLFFIFG